MGGQGSLTKPYLEIIGRWGTNAYSGGTVVFITAVVVALLLLSKLSITVSETLNVTAEPLNQMCSLISVNPNRQSKQN
jgi:hypothetical protein